MKVKNDHRSKFSNWKIYCDDHSSLSDQMIIGLAEAGLVLGEIVMLLGIVLNGGFEKKENELDG